MEQADQADATPPEPTTTTQADENLSADVTPTEPATSQPQTAQAADVVSTPEAEPVASEADTRQPDDQPAAQMADGQGSSPGAADEVDEQSGGLVEVNDEATSAEAAAVEPEPAPTAAAAEAAAVEPEPAPTAAAAEAAAVEPEPAPTAAAAETAAAGEPTATVEPTATPAEAAAIADAAADDAATATAEPDTAVEAAEAPAAPVRAARQVPTVFEGPEPTTMEELLSLQQTEIKSLKHGDVVEGTVVRIDKDEILVDIGAKSEGVISNRELYGRNAESQPELHIGDTVLVYVLQPESPEGHAVLSLRRAGLERKWRAMQEQLEEGAIIEAPVIDHNKGGLIVDCGIRGFVPISQIVDFPRRPQNEQPRDAAQEIAEKLQPYVGRKLRLKILEVNRKANRLILSEKVALYEERREKRDELFSSLQVGQKVTGTVRSIAPFGVFVDLGGIDGLVHKSELSWNKVNNPEAGYRVGEEVEAEVIDINHERGRISLSIRRLQPDPWHSTVADLKVGDIIDGTVTKIVNFGAFVRVRDGLEGLIHISELSHQRVAHPGDVVREGQALKLKIISLEQERHRLGLSLKQAEEAPARPEPSERRERRPRGDRSYDMSQAVQEPEGGIDNTLAAAFAQVRQQMEETEAARGKPATDEEPEAAEQLSAAEQQAEPEAAEAARGKPATDEEPEAAEQPAAAEQQAEPEAAEAARGKPATDEEPEAAEQPAAAEQQAEPEAAEQPAAAEQQSDQEAATGEASKVPEPRRPAQRKGKAKSDSAAGKESTTPAEVDAQAEDSAES